MIESSPTNPPSFDVGLGTAFERLALLRLVVDWAGDPVPRSAVEGPVDGFAGLPGLHLLPLARRGTRVTVVSPSPPVLAKVERVYRGAGLERRLDARLASELPKERFDLVLSFNALSLVEDWRRYLAELARHGERVLLFVTHPYSYGALLRRGLRLLERERRRELFDHEASRHQVLETELRRHGRIVERAWVDCPWWPDLFVEAGQTLWSGSLSRLLRRPRRPTLPSRFRWGPDDYPWARTDLPAELASALARHPTFDGMPRVAPVFAHHRARLLETRGSTAFGAKDAVC